MRPGFGATGESARLARGPASDVAAGKVASCPPGDEGGVVKGITGPAAGASGVASC